MQYTLYLACALITGGAMLHAYNHERMTEESERQCIGYIIQQDMENEARTRAIAIELYKRLKPAI